MAKGPVVPTVGVAGDGVGVGVARHGFFARIQEKDQNEKVVEETDEVFPDDQVEEFDVE